MDKSEELKTKGKMKPGGSYVLIMRSGRSNNMVLKEVGDHFIMGDVGMERQLILVKNGTTAFLSLKAVTNDDMANFRKQGVVHEEGCVIPSPGQGLRASLSEVAIIEDSWRKMLPSGIVDDDGNVLDADVAVQTFPELAAYRLDTGQFTENPSAWPKGNNGQGSQPVFHVVDPNEEDEDEESEEF